MSEQEWIMCDSPIWDYGIWKAKRLYLTPCFRQVVLATIPFIFILIASTVNIYCSLKSCKTKKFQKPYTIIYWTKIVLSILLLIIMAGKIGYQTYFTRNNSSLIWARLYAPSIASLSMILVIVLQMLEKRQDTLNSPWLLLFWVSIAICGFFASPIFDLINDSINENTDPYLFVHGTIAYSIVLTQLIISSLSDPQYNAIWKASEDEYVIQHQTVLSSLLFSWLNRIVWYGYRNKINMDDLDLMHPEKKSIRFYQRFKKKWDVEQSKLAQKHIGNFDEQRCSKQRGNPLLWTLVGTAGPLLLAASVLELLFDLLSVVPPLLLDMLIQFIENEAEPFWHGIFYAIGLFVVSALSTLLLVNDVNLLVLTTLVPRASLTAAVYRKALRLSSSSKSKYTLGELCNLLSVDIQTVYELIWSINLTWSAPLRIFLVIILLWRYLGVACLSGIGVMILIMPITGYFAAKTHNLQDSQMKRKDVRLRQMSEILNGIKILKLFAWELAFMKQISDTREKEVQKIKKLAFVNAGVVFFWNIAPFMVALASFVTFVMIDENNVLDPTIAFVSLSLFNQLRFSLTVIPEVVTDIVQSRISFQRLQTFLLSKELDRSCVGNTPRDGDAMTIDGATFAWSEEEEDPFLRDISLSVPTGSLVGIVGQVGAGKSALLSAILGEMHRIRGSINVRKTAIAYVAQEAWIQNATVQDNILFLRTMDKGRYEKVIEKCCLNEDLNILPGGDQTEIGEKGVNLSGGQKQRVSMARAVYQDTEVYLLDDPLSAVDSHVGARIFNDVIGKKGLLKNKTRLLVTHDLSVLPEVDMVVVFENGRIMETGSYEELMKKGGGFATFVEEHIKSLKEGEETCPEEILLNDLPSPESPVRSLTPSELKEQMMRAASRISRTISVEDVETAKKLKKIKLVEAEKMEEGEVKSVVFLTYFRYASYVLIAFLLLSYITNQGFEIGSSVWLSEWSTDVDSSIGLRNLRIAVYGVLGIGQGVCILAASFFLAIATTRASKSLHSCMLKSILRSPLFFFEKTPVGRILNRFGKDISIIDINIPVGLNNFISSTVAVAGIIIIISINSPIFLLIMVPVGVVYIIIQRCYLATSRQVRRLQAVTLSPIMSNFSETVQGASTIRAFGAETAFINKEDNLVDDNVRAFYCSTLLNRWLSIRLELLGCVIIFVVALLAITGRTTIGAGIAGLTLSYALNITDVIATMVKFYTNLEIRMVSVERVDEYSLLPSEASWESLVDYSVPPNWPNNGAVIFKNYQLRYNNCTTLALKNINMQILPKEKVGVVGRTGAGKSSLTMALFRILEPAGGSIRIDDVDIAHIGLHHLRSKITIIPQDPILFSGTIRLNLDPLNQHSDEELWQCLDQSHLRNFIENLGASLLFKVTENGDNLSTGQKQQLCLARALLKKTKILVLDEATAAVDMETDRLIQCTIREEFRDCTVITIAHRLYTILDYDRIIVMDQGEITEEGKPDDLLQNSSSAFSQLARDAGLL